MAIRCFVALNLSPEVKAHLAELQAQLKQAKADVSWVKPENIHLTLKFLGEVEEERIPAIKCAIQEGLEGEGRLLLTLAGLGTFPHPRSPRVIWVGIEGEKERLSHLQERMEQAMEKVGFPREGRPFSPHLTLGRVRSARGLSDLLDLLGRQAGSGFGTIEAQSIELMQSQLHPAGAIYSILESFPLAAAARPAAGGQL
jgi:2'-5' RNA ligase